jgi:tetratricopeptide (TPR) repeat protein
MGFVRQSLGDEAGARADYAAAIATDPKGDYARAAKLNLVKLDADMGAVSQAVETLNALVVEYPDDPAFRLGRAQLALRLGRVKAAEADLSLLLDKKGGGAAEIRAQRALALLKLHRPTEADADAAEAVRLDPTPSHERLRTRTLLALGRAHELPLAPPEQWTSLPVGGPSLEADLRRSASRLGSEPFESDSAMLRALMTRALLLSALRDPEAEVEADRAVTLAPLSAQVYLVRAWVRHHRGGIEDALADVSRGLSLQPDHPLLWRERGRLHRDAGLLTAALADFDHSLRHHADNAVRGDRAAVLLALGEPDEAIRDGSLALAYDPDDPRAYLGRARAFLRLRHWDQALADLEQAAGWADGQPRLLMEIALAYARCLPHRPQRLSRVLGLVRQAWAAATPTPGY